jgi:hypothetical protein
LTNWAEHEHFKSKRVGYHFTSTLGCLMNYAREQNGGKVCSAKPWEKTETIQFEALLPFAICE